MINTRIKRIIRWMQIKGVFINMNYRLILLLYMAILSAFNLISNWFLRTRSMVCFHKGNESLDNGYFDKFDNEFSNKYEKNS
jgi:hypothetical protein